MKASTGSKNSQVKPYTFNPQPFLADRRSAMQGYVTAEPSPSRRAGADSSPSCSLLADQRVHQLLDADRDAPATWSTGGPTSCSASSTRRSSAGIAISTATAVPPTRSSWKHNHEATDELNAYSTAKMKNSVSSTPAMRYSLGIGAMTDARMRGFFDAMVKAGVTKSTVDIRKSYTTQFVNKEVGSS
jgi:NitT/TauT family transport system substrate-binding protein